MITGTVRSLTLLTGKMPVRVQQTSQRQPYSRERLGDHPSNSRGAEPLAADSREARSLEISSDIAQ